MPYINTTTSAKITAEQKKSLTEAFGKAIELIPGKTEQWLMLNFNDESKMAFRGDGSVDCAMIEVDIFGKAKAESLENLTRELCRIISATLGVPSDRTYVKYREVDTWGYDGFNF